MAYYTESDPRFAPRTAAVGDAEQTITPQAPHERVWIALARQEGVEPMVLSGSGDMQEYVVNPAYVTWKANKKAQGFDVGMQDIPGTNYSKQAVITQNGSPIGEPFTVKTGNTLLEGAIELAPIILAAVGGQYLGAGGTASAAGQQAALTAGNVLGGATAALPVATGAGAAGAGAAGTAAGIAEGMAPGVLAPATAAETAGVNALLTGGAGTTGAAGAGAAGIAEGMAPGVVAPATAAELAGTDAVLAGGAGAAGAAGGAGSAAGSTVTNALTNAAAGAGGAASAGNIWGPLISSLASLYGGQQTAEAANRAAELYSQQMADALKLQRDIYEQGVERQRPFLEQGTQAFNRLVGLQTSGPEAAQQFLQMDPGYGFRLSEGMKALERQQAARGNLLSGGALKAGQRYAQDVASQEYGNAYNRLAQLANVGPAAAGVTNALGQNYATGASNLMGQQGQVGANALLTGAAARQSAYGDVGQIWGKYLGG